MPRNVRNFWIEADIDGYATTIQGGPKNGDGGFTEEIYIRDCGGVKKAISISGRREGDFLVLNVSSVNGEFFTITVVR